MNRTRVRQALEAESGMDHMTLCGWVRTKRDAKGFSFLELNDGSCLKNIQVIIDEGIPGFETLPDINTGASVKVEGSLVESPGKGQKWEVRAQSIELIGFADPETFPLQKKRHSDEFLRTIAHLRPRTNKYGAITRIRSELSYAIHTYFRDKDFFYIHSPVITGSDCEGAGEMFTVSGFDFDNIPMQEGKVDFSQDFFGKRASLTVSGQLSAENMATALGDVYTFGPTFRAENSNTPRHAAEFWMLEPEMAFADLNDDMDLGEECTKYLINHVREHCRDDLEIFGRFVDKSLFATLDNIVDNDFVRLPYGEAIEILKKAKAKFEYPVEFGLDLQTEHERYLTEKHFKKPVAVYDYPKEIKAFYMRLNDDNRTVAAVDILVPRIGELIGGSQREERLDVLDMRIKELGLNMDEYWWYRDLRHFGTVPHAGFGMGFERLLMLITGVSNIRDVISFPRTVNHLEF
ncbi:asparagine--tRNA ligase [Desulfoplanes formicivorans]|uniref:Asparagine--tRNA ligase n=1 Tax=Desulfoplanes formicivorans TaxID=1592317 RepID=A0A194AF46_9BACT|nr:asparagine--tRNA ligase [Desulfoplanes formicivorans]GAU07716.1 asparaginyl-tRNA synthetase [Desulfoplanes formicivorans]